MVAQNENIKRQRFYVAQSLKITTKVSYLNFRAKTANKRSIETIEVTEEKIARYARNFV